MLDNTVASEPNVVRKNKYASWAIDSLATILTGGWRRKELVDSSFVTPLIAYSELPTVLHSQDAIDNLKLKVTFRRKVPVDGADKADNAGSPNAEISEFCWGQRVFSTHEVDWVRTKEAGDATQECNLPSYFYNVIKRDIKTKRLTGHMLSTLVEDDLACLRTGREVQTLHYLPDEMRIYASLEDIIGEKKKKYVVELFRVAAFAHDNSIHMSPAFDRWHKFTLPGSATIEYEYKVENASAFSEAQHASVEENVRVNDSKQISLRRNLVGTGFSHPHTTQMLVVGQFIRFTRATHSKGEFSQSERRWENQAILDSVRVPSLWDIFRPCVYIVYEVVHPGKKTSDSTACMTHWATEADGRATFNHPFEFYFGWCDEETLAKPCRLLLQAFCKDVWNRHRFIGYSLCDVPTQPGVHTLRCRFWYPEAGYDDRLKVEYCGGFRPLLNLFEVGAVRNPKNWSAVRSASGSGALHIQFNVVRVDAKEKRISEPIGLRSSLRLRGQRSRVTQ